MNQQHAVATPRRNDLPDLRRRRLLWALPGGLAAASPLTLLGCGGGGGSGREAVTPTASARLALPAGSPLRVQDLRFVNAFGESRIAEGGGAPALSVAEDDAGMVMAVDPTGRVVLFGHVDPRGDAVANTVDALSAAVSLVFMAINGMGNSSAVRRTVLSLLRSDPAVLRLGTALAARLVDNPYALDEEDSSVERAVAAAVGEIMVSASAAAPGAAHARALALKPQVRLEPSQRQSGVELLIDPGADDRALPVNHARRECAVFAYRVAYSTQADPATRIALPMAERLANGDALPASGALGGVVTLLEDILRGTAPLVPVNGQPLTLLQKEGEARTWCDVIVLGASTTSAEPAFFGEPHYAGEVERWREVRGRLNAISWLRDVLFGLLLEVWGLRSAATAFTEWTAVLSEWETFGDEVLRAVLRDVKAGRFSKALGDTVRYCANQPTPLNAEMRRWVQRVATQVAGRTAQVSEALVARGSRALVSLFSAVPTVALGAIDLGMVLRDLDAASQGDVWTATLVRPTVTISPVSGRIDRGGELTLSVNVTSAPPGATFAYAWTLEGSDLANLAAEGKVGRNIETTGEVVTLAVTASTQGTLTVRVEAFVVEGGARQSVGTATSRIEVSDAAVRISPTEARLARTGGAQSFAVNVVSLEPVDPASLRYEWTCPSQYGSLTSGNQTTSAAQPTITTNSANAVYTLRSAGLEGGESEPVSVLAHTGDRNRALGEANAEVMVELPYSITLAALPPETPADNTLGVTAGISEPLPAGTTVEWTWSHRGVGSLRAPGDDSNKPNSVASFDSGSAEGQAIFTVQARVQPPGQQPVLVLPVTAATQVKRGLRRITFVASGGVFGCSDPRACGVSAYTAYIVPLYSKATGYSAVFTDFGYPGCNRRVDSWTNTRTVSDRGDCAFPVTYHPHNATGATNAFAVWIGFGGAMPSPGTCTVTVTFAP